MSENAVIVLSDISKTYRSKCNPVHALQNINLQIPNGAFVSITGQSGSGKSTLMNILGCLDTPTSGEYFLDGVSVSEMSERQLAYLRNQMIGFIFQKFNLISSLTALENVELPLIYRHLKKSTRRNLALSALEQVGLSHRIHHRPSELSGGQQQRVAIARALAATPKLILADEPTGNLDTASGNDIMKILKNLHKNGSTIVLITHDSDIAAQAETCITISDGQMTNYQHF